MAEGGLATGDESWKVQSMALKSEGDEFFRSGKYKEAVK